MLQLVKFFYLTTLFTTQNDKGSIEDVWSKGGMTKGEARSTSITLSTANVRSNSDLLGETCDLPPELWHGLSGRHHVPIMHSCEYTNPQHGYKYGN